MGLAGDLDGDSFEGAELGLGVDLRGEGGVGDAGEGGGLVEVAEAFGVAEGHAGGDSGAGGAAVDFGIGEDADIFGRGVGGVVAVGEDGAVEES